MIIRNIVCHYLVLYSGHLGLRHCGSRVVSGERGSVSTAAISLSIINVFYFLYQFCRIFVINVIYSKLEGHYLFFNFPI